MTGDGLVSAPARERQDARGFASFVTETSQPGDGPPEWPKDATWRIVGIACPSCGHESRDPIHRNAGSFLRTVVCSGCGWRGRVPL